jgi:limonene-1,2-epoxide hydrolase
LSDPVEIVSGFFARWGPIEDVYQSFRDCLGDDAVWENVGMTTTVGIDPAIALIRSYGDRMPLERFSVEILHTCATEGGIVFNERIDHVHDAAGAIVGSIRVMGIFRVVDDRIVEWRDYFNGSIAGAKDPA